MLKLTYIKSKSQILIALHRFDELDMKLLYELIQDSSISVPILSQKLGINASVLYSRIKRLLKKKILQHIITVMRLEIL